MICWSNQQPILYHINIYSISLPINKTNAKSTLLLLSFYHNFQIAPIEKGLSRRVHSDPPTNLLTRPPALLLTLPGSALSRDISANLCFVS